MLSFFDDFDELEKGNDKPFSRVNEKENEKEKEKENESVDNTDIIKDLTEVKKSIEELSSVVNTFGDLIKELKYGTGANDN